MQATSPDPSKQAPLRTALNPNEHATLLQNYASDPKFKKYTQQVEKCLNSFDNVQEWADFISFLKQLLKTLQSYMQFKEIPRKIIVSKRLSQCLNPALPTGVHQRALDVYSHILAVLGSEGLKRDLALWSSGLFPFFQYAATSVKPTLLNLYDTHFLPLKQGLRPVMKSFIVALLPGLEEETGEYFEKVLGLLDKLSATVTSSFLLQNIWLIMLTNPAARGTSLNYLSRRLPTLNPEEDVTSIVGRDIGLMIRAFAAALEDDNLLVRRSALDLLVTSLRLNSISVKNARADDRAILMRASYSVILRRDLALNRRLYLWLLGPDENAKQQDVYFRENALDLLKYTLEEEMFKPSTEYPESRPFKIFVSLLDKWEIGGPLTEVLVYNAFKAIKGSVEANPDNAEEMVMTASTLYEAVEPHTVWKQLLNYVILEILGDTLQVEAIRMVKFVLESFHVQDEEIQTIHLPIVFSALSEAIRSHVEADPTRASSLSVREALLLQEEILRHIPHVALKQRPEIEGQPPTVSKLGPFAFACSFYELKEFTLKLADRECLDLPFVTSFEDLASLSTVCAKRLLTPSKDASLLREAFSQSVLLIMRLLGRMDQRSGPPFVAQWNPAQWLSGILECLEQPISTFTMVDRLISLAVALHQTETLQPKLKIDNRSIMFKMITILLKYLRPEFAMYHVRAVNLIWQLENATTQPHVESIIAQSLTAPQSKNNHGAYEAFGVLWRLTDDSLLPGFKFRVPVMITLDTLKSEDVGVRRIGETWMRCSLKSYLRVLDPILHDLLDPAIRRSRSVTKLNGRELQDFSYEGPLDQRLMNHLLDILLSVVRFGQGVAKVARSTQIRRSPHPGLVERAEAAGVAPEGATYIDVLVELLIRLLKSEVKSPRLIGMQPFNATTQSLSVELLQSIVARGEVDQLALETIEAAVVGKLYFSVQTERLDLQNKLLHLLHSVISALTTIGSQPYLNPPARFEGPSELPTPEVGQESTSQPYNVNPLLVQTLIDGIGTLSNRPVLQHWLDFILMTVPQFHHALQAVVAPLIDCVCRQLRSAMKEVVGACSRDNDNEDSLSSITDAELNMLLHAVERLLLLSLSKPSDPAEMDDDSSFAEKPNNDGTGLLGYVSTVFSSDNTSVVPEEQLTARSTAYRSLHGGVSVLYAIWITFEWKNPQPWTSKDDSLSHIYNRTRARCRRVLEHLFRAHSAEVLESIIDCWNTDVAAHGPDFDVAGAFQLVDLLTSSAQTVVHMLCESISSRLPVVPDKHRKAITNMNLTDAILFRFLERYVGQLEGPVAMQVWGRFMQLVKEVVNGLKDLKVQAFHMLRCLSVLADKVIQTTAVDDRRLRKELQENYGKLLDSCVSSISRLDQGTWIRRGTKDALVVNGRDSPLPRVVSDAKLDEKVAASPVDVSRPWATESIDQITQYVASDAIPSMRKFLMDNDKVLAACNNIVYYVVNPSVKGKARALDLDPVTVELLREMSRLNIGLKAWRGPVVDALNDARFFNSSPAAGQKWRPIVRALVDTDKTAFPEVLNKVTTAPSANIFSNREYEMLIQSLNLRRLTYVLFTGDKNQFLAQLPTVQEKLVDTLRNVSAAVIQSEVYLCVRVLLCRLSAHNLTSFWPVILTELYRLFEQALTSVPADGSEDLPLVLSACKFLDLLLVLQTEEFQIHQWIFITDTVDAIYRPEHWVPDAMMDRLAEVATDAPSSQNTPQDHAPSGETPTISTFVDSAHPMRRPMLNSIRQIESIRDLAPFFSSVSITSYESVYASGGNIDWDAIEKGLMDDMFDGR